MSSTQNQETYLLNSKLQLTKHSKLLPILPKLLQEIKFILLSQQYPNAKVRYRYFQNIFKDRSTFPLLGRRKPQ